ncbi:MAG TPA: hypothetical protein VF608_09750 [Thermoanaerobaculia bacterium]
MNLEDDLKRALHRESPAPGFAQRVLSRIERDEHRIERNDTGTARDSHRRRPVWWRAIAASLTLTVLGGWAAHSIHERREGERAKEQLILAMRIAGEKVHYAQQEVREIGSTQK